MADQVYSTLPRTQRFGPFKFPRWRRIYALRKMTPARRRGMHMRVYSGGSTRGNGTGPCRFQSSQRTCDPPDRFKAHRWNTRVLRVQTSRGAFSPRHPEREPDVEFYFSDWRRIGSAHSAGWLAGGYLATQTGIEQTISCIPLAGQLIAEIGVREICAAVGLIVGIFARLDSRTRTSLADHQSRHFATVVTGGVLYGVTEAGGALFDSIGVNPACAGVRIRDQTAGGQQTPDAPRRNSDRAAHRPQSDHRRAQRGGA